jgi:uncharacterized protein YqhQ
VPFLPIGGQAVIEGVMMRSPSCVAVAVRQPGGALAFDERPFASITRRVRVLGLPVVRGAVGLVETMMIGIAALNFSAEQASHDEKAAPGAPAAGPSAAQGAIQLVTVAISLVVGVLVFLVLPARLTGWLGFKDRVGFGLVDGLIRLVVFVAYLALISQWKEMRRVLGYHGAEHKAIHALEAGVPLTPENVQRFSRFHPRCGTSFLFLLVVISVVVFTFIGRPHGIGQHLLRIAAMPLIAGVAFEFIRLSARYAEQPLVRALVWPGLQFQRLTTREPDLDMCAVAIAALERVRGDEQVMRIERASAPAPAEVAFIQ